MQIKHQIVSLNEVLAYYAAGFQVQDGSKRPIFSRAYVDTSQQVVIFELYIENEQELKYRVKDTP